MWASKTHRSSSVPHLNMAGLSLTLPVPKGGAPTATAAGAGGGGKQKDKDKEKHEEPVTVGVRIRPLTPKGADLGVSKIDRKQAVGPAAHSAVNQTWLPTTAREIVDPMVVIDSPA